LIKGLKIKKLKIISDYRGRLMEILRSDDEMFKKFGQVYMTTVKPNIVKGWHFHKKQSDTIVCIKGKLRLGLYDSREDSETNGEVQEIFLTEDNPVLLQIPPGVYHGWENIDKEEAIVISVPDFLYNYKEPDEIKLDPFKNEISFKWYAKKGG